MGVNRIIYNVQDVFVGPDSSEQPTIIGGTHLLQRLQRVKTFRYDINVPRTNITELGAKSVIASPVISHPEITVNIEYCMPNVANELRLGMNPNWNISGTPQYIHNFPLFSGFMNTSRSYDKRNIYVAVSPSGADARRDYAKTWTGLSGSVYDIIDPNSRSFQVFCFSDCYMTSYTTEAAVGEFIKVSTNYLADDLCCFVSGSGVKVPKINKQTRQYLAGDKFFALPKSYDDGQPSVLLPGDITIDIKQVNYHTGVDIVDAAGSFFVIFDTSVGYRYKVQYFDTLSGNFWKDIVTLDGNGASQNHEDFDFITNATGNYRVLYWPIEMENLGALMSDAKINSFAVNVGLDRDNVSFLGYKMPVDRPILLPIYADLSFTMLIGEHGSGQFLELLNRQQMYDVVVSVRHPAGQSAVSYERTALRYEMGRSQFVGMSYDSSVGTNKIATLRFRTEIVPNSFESGVFMSGIVATPFVFGNLLISETGEYIQTEDSFILRAEDILYGPTSF